MPVSDAVMPGASFTTLLWFLAVIVLIPLALWLLKRTPLGGAGQGAGAPRTVGVLALSASQKLVTVEVGQGEDRTWLVLGVTPQSICTLHTLLPQHAGPEAVAAPPVTAFAQLLTRLRQPGTGGDAH